MIINERLDEVLKLIFKLNSLNSGVNKHFMKNLKIDKVVKHLLKTKLEIMYVKKKNGQTSIRQIDHNINLRSISQIQGVVSKNRPEDLFSNLKNPIEKTISKCSLRSRLTIPYLPCISLCA